MAHHGRIARKAQKAHKRQQEIFRKQNLPSCEGCEFCSATKAREVERDSHATPSQRQQHNKSAPSLIRRRRLRNKLFNGDIFINPRHVALAEAANEVDFGAEQVRSVYWSDGSRLNGSHCGIGVAYRTSAEETWAGLSWSIRGSVQPYELKICAIAKALEIARERCRSLAAEQRPSSVCIYSDCPSALEYFRN